MHETGRKEITLPHSAENSLVYYASPGPMTDPGTYAALFDGLPSNVSELVKVVQGLLLHIFWAERYGVVLSDERQNEVQIRAVPAKLARIQTLHSGTLTEARTMERRLVGNCRDFAVMLCAMLRYHAVPARARCGFGTYFLPGYYEDHWVCEYWNRDQGRWVMLDAQLDAFQREVLSIGFDPLDMPPNQFVTSGEAWQMCRAGEADPERFGIFDMHGIWFVRGNLIRDFLSLNKVEILPWDGGWGFLIDEENMQSDIMDRIAALSLAGDEAFAEIRATYASDDRFHVPIEWLPAGSTA
jgi:hypothetical protein